MPASDSWHSGRKTTSTLSFWYQLSTCSFAASVPCSVISLRVSFNSLSSSARRSASSSLCARRSASASFAVFNRPPAFRHGPMTNPIWYAVIAPRSRLFFSASLRCHLFKTVFYQNPVLILQLHHITDRRNRGKFKQIQPFHLRHAPAGI